MSWPKAFIRHNGTTRSVTVWGCRPRTELVAVEIYTENGYESEIISEQDIISINWECSSKFPHLEKREHIKTYFDGYGADVKQKIYEESKKNNNRGKILG